MENPNYGLALAASVTLIIVAGAGLFLYLRAIGERGRYVTVTGKGYRAAVVRLGAWRWGSRAFILLFGLVGVGLPTFALAWASLLPLYQMPSLEVFSKISLDQYVRIMESRKFLEVVQNTLILGSVVSGAGMILASVISWILIRLRPRGSGVLDFLVFIPFAIPGIVLAFAYMVLLLATRSPLYGTIWALVRLAQGAGPGLAATSIAGR